MVSLRELDSSLLCSKLDTARREHYDFLLGLDLTNISAAQHQLDQSMRAEIKRMAEELRSRHKGEFISPPIKWV